MIYFKKNWGKWVVLDIMQHHIIATFDNKLDAEEFCEENIPAILRGRRP